MEDPKIDKTIHAIQNWNKLECEGCKKTFDREKFFKHLSHAKNCKNVYGDERYNVLKNQKRKENDKDSRADARKWANFEDMVLEQKIAEENGENWKENHEIGLLLKCDGCDENYFTDTFFKHISHSKRCKEVLGKEKFELMKKEKRKMVRHQSYKKNEAKRKDEAKIYHSTHKQTRNDKKKEKYNEKREENLKQLQIMKKEAAIKAGKIQRKIAKENFEKYSRLELAVWKNCRIKDIKKFEATNVREDLSSQISTLTYELNETFKDFEKRIDEIVLSTNEINEMKALKSVHDNFNVDFRNHHTKVDDSFKEMAANLATRILCFQCIYLKKIGGLYQCDGSGCDVFSAQSNNSKKSSKTNSKNTTSGDKNIIRKRKPVTLMNELEKEVEHDDDFKVELKKKKTKKTNDQLTSQSKANRKKKNPKKKATKNLDYDNADGFQVTPNSRKGIVDFQVKSVTGKSSPSKQISNPNIISNPEKNQTDLMKERLAMNEVTQSYITTKSKPKFTFSKLLKD